MHPTSPKDNYAKLDMVAVTLSLGVTATGPFRMNDYKKGPNLSVEH
jgi:hypothetical protein